MGSKPHSPGSQLCVSRDAQTHLITIHRARIPDCTKYLRRLSIHGHSDERSSQKIGPAGIANTATSQRTSSKRRPLWTLARSLFVHSHFPTPSLNRFKHFQTQKPGMPKPPCYTSIQGGKRVLTQPVAPMTRTVQNEPNSDSGARPFPHPDLPNEPKKSLVLNKTVLTTPPAAPVLASRRPAPQVTRFTSRPVLFSDIVDSNSASSAIIVSTTRKEGVW